MQCREGRLALRDAIDTKATVKRADYVQRLATHVQTCLATNQVVASCVNTDFWLDTTTRESRHKRDLRLFLQNKFALGR